MCFCHRCMLSLYGDNADNSTCTITQTKKQNNIKQNMESPTPNPAAKDFQVAGVSRSGRVRKKSSKLLDFESPEEIEKKTKRHGRQTTATRYLGRGRPPNSLRDREQEPHFNDHSAMESGSSQTLLSPATDIDMRVAILNSDEEVDTLVQDLVDGVEAEATNESKVRQSLYMREKSNKRKILKDGKIVTGKMQRKDKGKSRYTAYSLWAREARKRDVQELDFANSARRLSELWANVSNKEKSAWKRKAKIQATKARAREKNVVPINNTPTTVPTNGLSSEQLVTNRATTSRTKKLAIERRQHDELISVNANLTEGKQKKNNPNRGRNGVPGSTSTNFQTTTSAGGCVAVMSYTNETEPGKALQITNIEAIDAAAHLKLLGESLTVIGERLKEHNGHVALSGSLSVLLDSLLCSMGPLLCMTTHIPGLENKSQLSKNLATTLDNIAYVMPGL